MVVPDLGVEIDACRRKNQFVRIRHTADAQQNLIGVAAGMANAGFHHAAVIEWNPDACETFRDITAAYRVPRYNLFPAAELQGNLLPGYSTGYALDQMEKLAAERLPSGSR